MAGSDRTFATFSTKNAVLAGGALEISALACDPVSLKIRPILAGSARKISASPVVTLDADLAPVPLKINPILAGSARKISALPIDVSDVDLRPASVKINPILAGSARKNSALHDDISEVDLRPDPVKINPILAGSARKIYALPVDTADVDLSSDYKNIDPILAGSARKISPLNADTSDVDSPQVPLRIDPILAGSALQISAEGSGLKNTKINSILAGSASTLAPDIISAQIPQALTKFSPRLDALTFRSPTYKKAVDIADLSHTKETLSVCDNLPASNGQHSKLAQEITDSTFDSLAPAIGITSKFSSHLFLHPTTNPPDKNVNTASPPLQQHLTQTNPLSSVNILQHCDVTSDVSVDMSNDEGIHELMDPPKACYYLIDLENVLIKPLTSVISDISTKVINYMGCIDSRGTHSTTQLMSEVKRNYGLLGDQIYHKLQEKHTDLDSDEFYSFINSGIADIIKNHSAPHPIREFQLPTFILSHNCQNIAEAIVQAAGLHTTTKGTIGTPPKMILPLDEEIFTHAVARMAASLGTHVAYEDILYISGDPKRLRLATNLGMTGIVYDYRQLQKECVYASTLTPTKKRHFITNDEITAHLTDLEYSSSSNDSLHAQTTSLYSSVDDIIPAVPSVNQNILPSTLATTPQLEQPLSTSDVKKVNYAVTLADLQVQLETQHHTSILKLERKFADNESRLKQTHDAAFASLKRDMKTMVTKMQVEHERKLSTKTQIDIEQQVEERGVESDEYIRTTTRQMEANWTKRSNYLLSTLEKKVHSAESRIDTIVANCKKIEDCRSSLQSDQKAVAKLHDKSQLLVKDITREKECFKKEAQRQIDTLNNFCNSSKVRLVAANTYHDAMSVHDQTYALQLAKQKSQIHSHTSWLQSNTQTLQTFMDKTAITYKAGLDDISLNYTHSEAARIMAKVDTHEADFCGRVNACWTDLCTQITQEARQVEQQGTHYLNKVIAQSENFDTTYEDKITQWATKQQTIETSVKNTHQTLFLTQEKKIVGIIEQAAIDTEAKYNNAITEAIAHMPSTQVQNMDYMTQADKLAINTDIIDIRLSIPSEHVMQACAIDALNDIATNDTLKTYLQELVTKQTNSSIHKEQDVLSKELSDSDHHRHRKDTKEKSKPTSKRSGKNHKHKSSRNSLPRDTEFPSVFDKYDSGHDESDYEEQARKRFRERPNKSGDNPPSDPSSSDDSGESSDSKPRFFRRGKVGREGKHSSRDTSPFHVDTYKLNKAFSHSCETMEDLLQFYEDHISTLEEFGIDMIPLNEIREGKSLFKYYKSMTKSVQQKQTKILHNIYIKEEVFPKTNILSRSILKASTRDKNGEQAMYEMLRGVVPALTKNPAPDSPPDFEECGDIYVFGSQLMNFFMLKELTGTRYTEYHKAEQFLKCLAHTEHSTTASKLYT